MAQRVRKNCSPSLYKGGPIKATQQFAFPPIVKFYQAGANVTGIFSSSSKRSPAVSPTISRKESSSTSHRGERPKPLRVSPSAPVSCQIRRTASLETIAGNYLTGQWPRLSQTLPHRQHDKCTQFPEKSVDSFKKPGHKRSASVDNGDPSIEKGRLKQNRARNKYSIALIPNRHSPVSGPIRSGLTPPSRVIAIPFNKPRTCRGSVEGLNAEIADIVLSDRPVDQVCDRPLAPYPRSSSARSSDKQTPKLCDSCGSSPGLYSSGSRPDSSPRLMESKGTMMSDSPDPSSEVAVKFSSSPRPNKSYQLTREPPDGCDKVAVVVDEPKIIDEHKSKQPPVKESLFLPRNSFKPSQNSAFAPLKGPITPHPSVESRPDEDLQV